MKNIIFKKLSLIVTLVLLTLTLRAQKSYLNEHNTPGEIKEFVQNYFPNHRIIKAKKEVKPLKTKYELKLEPKVEIEFDENYNLIELESKNGVPLKALPIEIQKYFRTNMPNVEIKEWEKKHEGQKVKLMNGNKLYFDNKGKFVGEKNKAYY